MKNVLFLAILCLTSTLTFSQEAEMPQFPGGDEGLTKFIKANVYYPLQSKEKGVTGIVEVRFKINTDSTISDIQIIKGLDSLCNAEAIRVVKLMPKWKPGSQNGKPVKVRTILPIRFDSNRETSYLTDPNYKLGKEAFEEGEFEKAADFFSKIHSEFNSAYAVITLKAETLIKLNQVKEGCKMLKKIKKKYPRADVAYKENC